MQLRNFVLLNRVTNIKIPGLKAALKHPPVRQVLPVLHYKEGGV
ncbi:hypothetical protein C1G87_0038 [Dehalococcoides mccartyi]|uniref:Uncharacterized protein n=1 Tax=Dehalococcoides mccartyi TaxID=61435 RepID=A0A328ER97_9CHLR|nr:hypothetical protein C1G87_0038 [Dehalococcoides mccartyi]